MKSLSRLGFINNQLKHAAVIARAPWKQMVFGTITERTFGAKQGEREASKMPVPEDENYFNYGVCMNPHFSKRDKGGEDAVCVGP